MLAHVESWSESNITLASIVLLWTDDGEEKRRCSLLLTSPHTKTMRRISRKQGKGCFFTAFGILLITISAVLNLFLSITSWIMFTISTGLGESLAKPSLYTVHIRLLNQSLPALLNATFNARNTFLTKPRRIKPTFTRRNRTTMLMKNSSLPVQNNTIDRFPKRRGRRCQHPEGCHALAKQVIYGERESNAVPQFCKNHRGQYMMSPCCLAYCTGELGHDHLLGRHHINLVVGKLRCAAPSCLKQGIFGLRNMDDGPVRGSVPPFGPARFMRLLEKSYTNGHLAKLDLQPSLLKRLSAKLKIIL